MNLFNFSETSKGGKGGPLADRMRPRNLEEFVGQEHLLGEGKVLKRAIESGEVPSLILWGPPGSGKTTLAHIIAGAMGSHVIAFSAVTSGVKEIKAVVREAREMKDRLGRETILFVDEIHRFNKAQQDAFLPHVERGTVILIGATTENPSFEVISPLLSRTKVLLLNPLGEGEVLAILERAQKDKERGMGEHTSQIVPEALGHIARSSDGDARVALNTLELAVLTAPPDEKGVRHVTVAVVEEAMQKKPLLYDKSGEEHYNLISALHKSLRGGDPDASLYWLARMIEGGEDPLYIARRMVRFASEDIGNADPQALQVALSAMEAFHFIGLPEGTLALAQAALYLATAPKSNAVCVAYGRAAKDAREKGSLPVPLHIRNAPTRLMKELGYGKGYKYPHQFPDARVDQDYMPDGLKGRTYYDPTDRGFEKEIRRRLKGLGRRKNGGGSD
jgi:putative ATPase